MSAPSLSLLIPIMAVPTLAAMLIAILAYDRILRWIYTNRKEEWVALGKPTGVFFKPTDATFWAGHMSRSQFGLRLLFYPPKCVRETAALSKDVWIHRAGYVCCLIGFVALIAVS